MLRNVESCCVVVLCGIVESEGELTINCRHVFNVQVDGNSITAYAIGKGNDDVIDTWQKTVQK
jgi:hypothetical protein